MENEKDFCIGNFILFEGAIEEIKDVDSNFAYTLLHKIPINEITPIRITRRIVQRKEFLEYDNDKFIINNRGIKKEVKIKYIHQLQNVLNDMRMHDESKNILVD